MVKMEASILMQKKNACEHGITTRLLLLAEHTKSVLTKPNNIQGRMNIHPHAYAGPRTLCNACGVKYKKGGAIPMLPVAAANSEAEASASGAAFADS